MPSTKTAVPSRMAVRGMSWPSGAARRKSLAADQAVRDYGIWSRRGTAKPVASLGTRRDAMSDPTTPKNSPSPAEVGMYLHTVAQLLRDVPHMAPETQQLVAELVDELSRALQAGNVPAAELGQLAGQVAELV